LQASGQVERNGNRWEPTGVAVVRFRPAHIIAQSERSDCVALLNLQLFALHPDDSSEPR
jgi:hypothetical protein